MFRRFVRIRNLDAAESALTIPHAEIRELIILRRLSFFSNGKVGIGETSPTNHLHLLGILLDSTPSRLRNGRYGETI